MTEGFIFGTTSFYFDICIAKVKGTSSPAQALLSFIITIAKYYIYKSKFYLKNLSIKGFENFLKQNFLSEMYKAKLNKTYDKSLGKWLSLYNYMITL